jgi:hypothetical protein
MFLQQPEDAQASNADANHQQGEAFSSSLLLLTYTKL